MKGLDAARIQLQRVVDDLQAVRYRLVGLLASVPPTRQETTKEDLDDVDAATEIRAAVASCLRDNLDPLIRDLSTAAAHQPGRPHAEPEESEALTGSYVEFDIRSGSEEMRRVLYGMVARDYFSPEPLEETPNEVWSPGYTPEQAGLQVVFLWGHWLAAWKKLEVPAEAPEQERWAAYRLEEDKTAPSTLFYVEF